MFLPKQLGCETKNLTRLKSFPDSIEGLPIIGTSTLAKFTVMRWASSLQIARRPIAGVIDGEGDIDHDVGVIALNERPAHARIGRNERNCLL